MGSKISTDRLRDGDKIKLFGATILIEGKPNITLGPTGTVYSWPNAPIIAGELEPYPGNLRWTIQGTTWEYWEVTRGQTP